MGPAELARSWFERVWQQREVAAIQDLCAPDAVGHLCMCEIYGPAGFVQIWHSFLDAIPDLQMDILDIVAEGDRAVVRWHVKGTHAGAGLGIDATQRRVDFTGMTMLRYVNEKIAEGWDAWDYGSVLAKLTAPPT